MQEQFITERRYLKNVTAKTLAWYRGSFKAFEGALESRKSIVQRITGLLQRGVSAAMVNTYLRCVNAYLRWLHIEHGRELVKIPKLQEEQKVLATLTPSHIERLLHDRPPASFSGHRLHALVCFLLDNRARIGEALALRREDLDLENLLIRIHGIGSYSYVVRCTSLDEYVEAKGISTHLIVKVDTQGGEVEVFKGMDCVLRQRPTTCISEFTPVALATRVSPAEWLGALAGSFHIFDVGGQDLFLHRGHRLRQVPQDAVEEFTRRIAVEELRWTDLLLVPKGAAWGGGIDRAVAST